MKIYINIKTRYGCCLMFRLHLCFFILLNAFGAVAQTISYPASQTYAVGTTITSLVPTVTGFTPTINGQTTTLAGNSSNVSLDGTGAAAGLNSPLGICVDVKGNFYLAEKTRIRKVTSSGVVTTIAGSATSGHADGTGAGATFQGAAGIAVDAGGNLFVIDEAANNIRKITPAGVVTTLAGNAGTHGYADGSGTSALFNLPSGIVIDPSGNLFIADYNNGLIRKVTPTGIVSTYAGVQQGPGSTDVDGSANTAVFDTPINLALDRSGNLYVVELFNNVVRKITPSGIVSTWAGNHVSAGYVNGTGTSARFQYPLGGTADATGNLYITDYASIRKIDPSDLVSTLSGAIEGANYGPSGYLDDIGVNAQFNTDNMWGLVVDSSGFVNVLDGTRIRRVAMGNFSISPALPTGLSFNVMTGTISGTPTTGSPLTAYTICAYYSTGFASTTLSFSVVAPGFNPSLDQNYIASYIPRVSGLTNTAAVYAASSDKTQVMSSIQYIDGIGRPLQTVSVSASPLGYDIVQPFAYDAYGRGSTKYLPYTPQTGTSGGYRSAAVNTDQGAFYNSPPLNSNVSVIADAYAQMAYDNSPLNRPVEQGAPGVAWQLTGVSGGGHTAEMVYKLNNSTTFAIDSVNSRQVARYNATVNSDQSRTLATNGYYAANTITVTISKDENWISGRAGTVEEYKDKMGRVLLKRQYNYTNAVQLLSTYYVFDDMGQLAFVLPPLSGADASGTISQTTLDNLCYQYRYDERGRLSQKKIPGKGWEYIVYNYIDQPVATQDSLQRAANNWIFTKYDIQGRPVLTGIWNNGPVSRAPLQTTLTGITSNLWETPSSTSNGYTNMAWPTTLVTATLSLNYYDNYAVPGLPSTYLSTTGVSNMTRGLPTAKKTAVLNTPTDLLWDVIYYDDLGRNIKSYAQHYFGGTVDTANHDLITTTYNFNNVPTTVTRRHWNNLNHPYPLLTIANTYIYDHMGRKLRTWEQVTNLNNAPTTKIVVAKNVYNEIGQVAFKRLHSTDSVNYLQSIAYLYNERGWLLQSSAPLFEMQLRYNTFSPNKQYNGNIAYLQWGTSTSPNTNTYTYTYDKLNRLTGGASLDNYKETGINYDPMGNITALNRYQNGTLIDQLSYNYLSGANQTNQAQTIADASGNNAGLVNGTTAYTYDGNGNMLTNSNSTNTGQNKTFTYNLLNLPKTVATTSGGFDTYTYDATGQKVRKVNVVGGVSSTIEYISGIQYKGTVVDFIQTEEGKVTTTGGANIDYYYYMGDNLGNTRVTFDTQGNSVNSLQKDDYYPFGLEITRGSVVSPKNEYLYNKKELQEELGQYDYGHRYYDPITVRWNTIDPLAEISRRWSPYNYVEDNPIKFTDPDGDSVVYGANSITLNGKDAANFAINFKIHGKNNADGDDKKKNDAVKNNKKGNSKSKQQDSHWYKFFNDHHPGGDALYQFNKYFNPIAGIVNLYDTYNNGKDSYGNSESTGEASVNLAMTIPIFRFGEVFNILGSTGRYIAANLSEQLAMEEIISNPEAGEVIKNMGPLNDSRWLGWRKMQYIKTLKDGTQINIHYVGNWVNGVLTSVDDFKFK